MNWRVYTLVQQGILERIGRGRFVLGKQQTYLPEISAQHKRMYNKILKVFPFLEVCIWNTSILNEFMTHQPFRFFTLVETQKDALSAVFHYLKESHSAVFLDPGSEILENYLPENKMPVFVLPLVSETPLQTVDGVKVATLEKILVDLFCKPKLFNAYQGSELSNIYCGAFERYTVNLNKLLRYARRRGKQNEIQNYLNKLKLPAINTS